MKPNRWTWWTSPGSSIASVEAQTDLSPREVLEAIQRVEDRLGRERTIPRGPRTIDIDVLLYDAIVLREPQLEIPHPRMVGRRFVLVPFAEIAPALVHPTSHRTIGDLLAVCVDRSEVRVS